jgi:shikimate kinase/3-dehydroquinate synthase
VRELLAAHGLPTTLERADPEDVVMATAKDKKRRGTGPVPFVLLEAPGEPRAGCPVQPRALLTAVRELAG